MRIPISPPAHCRIWRYRLQRFFLRCTAGAACLLAVIPAALAHAGELPPPPERVLWGLIAFLVVSTWVVATSLRAARPVPKKPLRRREREVPKWLQQALSFDPWSKERLPRKASRQVRRAYHRRRQK